MYVSEYANKSAYMNVSARLSQLKWNMTFQQTIQSLHTCAHADVCTHVHKCTHTHTRPYQSIH